jgi:hypothetical protein
MTFRAPVFSEKQQKILLAAAAQLPRSKRNTFFTGVAKRLGENPSNAAMEEAISQQLAIGRLPNFISGANNK